MSELVRSTVAGTVELLFGLIANPEAVDTFGGFFSKVDQRRFMMTVNNGEYKRSQEAKHFQFGTVVTLSIYAGEGRFEVHQAFLPVAEETLYTRGKVFFTDCIIVGPEADVTVHDGDIVDRGNNNITSS